MTARPERSAADVVAENALSVQGLTKSFGTTDVLRGIDLDVPGGSLAAVLGPSGSGKTTLLRTLAGFERPDRGTVRIGSVTVDDGSHHLAPERRGIGYVPQEGSLFPHLTVRQNVAFGLGRQDRSAADRLLQLVDMEAMSDRYPHQLSGGQQQRVALARALAVRPAVVLLDEPFSSLDAAMREGVRNDVRRILGSTRTTGVLVTHDQDEALSFADVVAVIRDGRIAQLGPPRDVYSSPVDATLAKFVGDANLLGGRLVPGDGRTVVRTVLGDLELRHGLPGGAGDPGETAGEVVAMVRPEQIDLVDTPAAGGWPGRVVSSAYHGHDAVIRVAARDANGPADGGDGVASDDGAVGASEITVRLAGHDRVSAGALVILQVRGPVLVWETGADRA